MTFLVERLAELRRHLDHLTELRPRVGGADALQTDFSLRNDVLFSLLSVCQLVIDIASELSARRGARFENYTEAIRGLGMDARFSAELVDQLVPLAGFRNVVIREYVALDFARVIDALNNLQQVEEFSHIVARMEADSDPALGPRDRYFVGVAGVLLADSVPVPLAFVAATA
jgi:uncharacterized protein YutE (UPF0331/DUF86 family)